MAVEDKPLQLTFKKPILALWSCPILSSWGLPEFRTRERITICLCVLSAQAQLKQSQDSYPALFALIIVYSTKTNLLIEINLKQDAKYVHTLFVTLTLSIVTPPITSWSCSLSLSASAAWSRSSIEMATSQARASLIRASCPR